jgi:hypothetical protein
MSKMQRLGTNKMIKKQIKHITTDVSVIKLIQKEEEFNKIEERILGDFGMKREVCFAISRIRILLLLFTHKT